MLSFEITQKGRVIQIYCDDAGVDLLIDTLQNLRGSGGHVHLCAPSHGGRALSDLSPFGDPAINEVIITHGGD